MLVLLTAGTFSNALRNGFVSFDDWFLVEESERIRSLAWGNVARMFLYQTNHTWLPLRELSYALDYHFWGLDPFGYHLTNVVLHTANVLLVYALLVWVLGRPRLALLGAAWFAVHPVQVESVTWVSGRRDVQYAFFFLLSFLAFLGYERRHGRRRWVLYGASLLCLACSLVSKPAAMSLPAVLVLTILVFGRFEPRLWRRLAACVPHGMMAAATVAVHWVVAQRAGVIKQNGLDASLANVPFIFAKYWRLLFLPVHLATPHGDSGLRWSGDLRLIGLQAAGVAAVVALVWWSAPRRDRALFCLGWWFLLLLPVSNLVPLSVLVAERYLYLPVVAACGFAAELAGGLMERRRGLALACALATVALFAAATRARNRVWADGRTFWKDGVSKWPGTPVTRIGLGWEYVEGNAPGLAWRQYLEVAVAGRSAASTNEEHLSLVKRGIRACYERLARQREAQGRKDAALDVYETVVRIMPAEAKPRVRLVEAYERLGEPDKAREQMGALQRLAHKREEKSGRAAARRVYETVVRLMPERVEPRVWLAEACEQDGLHARAREQVLAIKRLDPRYPGLEAWLERLEAKLHGEPGTGPKE